MMTVRHLVEMTLLVLVGVTCAVALAGVGDYEEERQYRDSGVDPRKIVRDNGLGNLLLKSLRFRDLARRNLLAGEMGNPLAWGNSVNNMPAEEEYIQTGHIPDAPVARVMAKRQNMDVSQLAQLLNNLKARNADDDGVKLQSLRFGRR